MTLTLLFWIAYLIGLLAGVIVTLLVQRMFTKRGYLRIDHSNPEKDVYRFEVDDLVDTSVRRFVLKVDHKADLSQK